MLIILNVSKVMSKITAQQVIDLSAKTKTKMYNDLVKIYLFKDHKDKQRKINNYTFQNNYK